MSALIAGVPGYYGVATPWVYPTNLIPQQGSQPRRPLTPSQQGGDNQQYQVGIHYYCFYYYYYLYFSFIKYKLLFRIKCV